MLQCARMQAGQRGGIGSRDAPRKLVERRIAPVSGRDRERHRGVRAPAAARQPCRCRLDRRRQSPAQQRGHRRRPAERRIEQPRRQPRRRVYLSRIVVQVRDHALQSVIEFGCEHEVEEIALGGGQAEGVAQSRPAGIRRQRGIRLRHRRGECDTGRIGCAEAQLCRRGLRGIFEQALDFARGDHQPLVGARSLLRPQPLHPASEQARTNADARDQQVLCGGGSHGTSTHQFGGHSTPTTRMRRK